MTHRSLKASRIAFVYDVLYPWDVGGVEKRYWEIARRLPRYGFEPHLFGPKYWQGPAAVERDGVWLHGIAPARPLYRPTGIRALGEAILFARDLLPALLRANIDLIDCCAYPQFSWFVAFSVSRVRDLPLLTTTPEFWGSYWRTYFGPRLGRLAQTIELAEARWSAQHVCLTPFTARRLTTARGSGRDIHAIPGGVDAARLGGYAAGLDERRGIVVVGRLTSRKRVADVLLAVDRVRATHPDCTVTVIGRGPEEANLRRLVDRLGLESAVTFRSDLDETTLYQIMGRAHCLVLSSEREGQGIVVAEAMATGTPPIVAVGPESAAAEMLQDGVDGLLYPVGDISALASAITGILDDADLWSRLSAHALIAAGALDWDSAIVPRMVALYRTMQGTVHTQVAR